MSLKRFSGWEPATVYEYDGAGRMVSSRPEVEWDETEQGWMLALERYRRETLCPLCGMPKDVCQAPYGQYVYKVGAPARCQVTTAIRLAQKDGGYDNPDGLSWAQAIQVTPWGTPSTE